MNNLNQAIWGTPYRPWWTYLGRDRRWRKALTAALTAVLAMEAGCATSRCGEMTRDQCEQLNWDLKKTEGLMPARPVAYDYGAGKKPLGNNQ